MPLVGVPLTTVRRLAVWGSWQWQMVTVTLAWITSSPCWLNPSESQPTSLQYPLAHCLSRGPEARLLAAPHTGTLPQPHSLAHGITSAGMPCLLCCEMFF